MTEKERVRGTMPPGTLMLVPYKYGVSLHLVKKDLGVEVLASTNEYKVGLGYEYMKGPYRFGLRIIKPEELVLHVGMHVGPVFESILKGRVSPAEAAYSFPDGGYEF
jgi:hypothetical protein